MINQFTPIRANSDLPEDKVADSIAEILQVWKRLAGRLQFGLVCLGVLAIGSSVCIGGFTENMGPLTTKILAAVSTLCLTLISSFSMASKASNVRDGWRHLNKAMLAYRAKIIDIKALITAYEEGEKTLGNVEFNFSKPQTTRFDTTDSTLTEAQQKEKAELSQRAAIIEPELENIPGFQGINVGKNARNELGVEINFKDQIPSEDILKKYKEHFSPSIVTINKN